MSRILLFIFFLIFFILCITKNRKLSHLQSFLIITTLTIIITFRDESMADYAEYVRIYNYQVESVEPIHFLLIRLFNSLDFKVIVYFFVIGLFTIIIQWNAIKKMIPDYWALALITWIGTSFVLNDMVTIRAGIAAAISLWIMYYKVQNRLWISLMLVLVATCCHMSAALLIIILFMSSVCTYKRLYICCLVGAPLFPILGISFTDFLGLIGIPIFDDKILIYLEGERANVFSLFQIIKSIIAILLWLNVDRLKDKNKYFLLALKVYTVGCIWYFATYKLMAIAWRISCIFWTADILVYPFLSFIIFRRLSPTSKLIPATICLLLFYVNMTMQQYWQPL